MKLLRAKIAASQGSVLLISLIFAAIAGVTLASYLIMVENQTVSVYRSQSWNVAMTVSEAGVEDALQLINRYAGSFEEDILPQWTNHAAAENWSSPSASVYYMTRKMPYQATSGAWFTNSYEVWITNRNNEPEIFATATVPWTFHYASAPQAMFAGIGLAVDGTSFRPPIRRNVHVKTKYGALWQVAMAAVQTIDLKGNNVATDSFDSADPNFSSAGQYPLGSPWKTKANGDVATTRAIVDSLNVGNAKIKGHVRTGPGDNTITIGPNGSVGDRFWVENGFKGIKDGWSATDFNVVFPDVVLPNSQWIEPVDRNVTIDGKRYEFAIFSAGDYVINKLDGSLMIDAPKGALVRILIKSSVEFTAKEVIRIKSDEDSGAIVRIYMAGAEMKLGGQSYIDNQGGGADRFYLFGLPSCQSITFSGNAGFYGGIYAPQATFALGGGGNDVLDFVGGSVTKTVMMNGHFNFHYDENLGKKGPGSGFIPVAWGEK